MGNLKAVLLPIFLGLMFNLSYAQNITQTIRGKVVDKDAQFLLIGANISITSIDPIIGTSTDENGEFKIENIPVGRQDIEVSYLGYEIAKINNVLLKSGKELVLNIELVESIEQLNEIVVKASDQTDKTKPLNEFAAVSARTFSVEETSRYAFSAFDPARMAQNYAGVSTAATGNDLFNEIVVRGNSPSGVLWRLEGIQIPNPNHFGAVGNSGGAISMLSSTTLSNSDFYTGAFPGEFGNALSGVFDLNMRNGNNEKHEFAFMLGALGIELATEGSFKKGSKSSYLFNYRYSTLAALSAVGLNPAGDILPAYQDLSFKVNLVTDKAGVFSIFGLGGNNVAEDKPEADSILWMSRFDQTGGKEPQNMGTIGLSHRILLSNKSYWRTVVVGSYEQVIDDEYYLDAADNYRQIRDYKDDIRNSTFRLSSTYHRKINARNTIRIGAIVSHSRFAFSADDRVSNSAALIRTFDNSGNTELIQAFTQTKSRLTQSLTLFSGLHYSLMTLNNKMALEPRAALQWKVNAKHQLSLAVGMHSKMEHPAVYLFESSQEAQEEIKAKKNLGLSKAFHAVLGYDWIFMPELRLKTEFYFQYLYDIPIGANPESTFSILNASSVWSVIGLSEAVPEGTGRNVGLDVTLEKFFSNQYYFLFTGSLYDSKFTPQNGKTYNTRFNGNYQMNILAGKEISIGKKKGKQNIFGINGKFSLSGGTRFTPIDLAVSQQMNEEILFQDRLFEDRSSAYYRFDIGMSYRVNKKRLTHTIMFDIQNVSNRLNIAESFYNDETKQIENELHTGLFPNFNYRIEF